jgi:hypothetical protein
MENNAFSDILFPARENSLIYVYAGEHEHIPTSPADAVSGD